jgi:hypothetical protein
MNRMVLDPLMVEKLRGVFDQLELCDTSGNVLGRFIPRSKSVQHPEMEPQISEEETQRRIQLGGGRPLEDILADLESRP